MKALVVSDLHVDFHRDGGRQLVDALAPADVCIIAGDMGECSCLVDSLRLVCKRFEHVVYVAGNHDLYMSSPSRLSKIRADAESKLPNLSWLDNETVEMGGTRFVGSTLWFPEPPATVNKHAVNDFLRISNFEPWVYEKHRESIDFVNKVLLPEDILITHHFPLRASIPRQYANSPLNAFFYAGPDAEKLVLDKHPRMAIHGHTHTSFDYKVRGRTRVVCNPFGYPGENPKFECAKIIEV